MKMSYQSDDLVKAKDLIRERKVAVLKSPNIKLRDHFVVTGSQDDYLVILPNFCTCTHFHINCIKEKGRICKHILACKLAGSNTRELILENWQDLIYREH